MISLALVGKGISHSKSQSVYETLLTQKIKYTLLDYLSAEDIPLLIDLWGDLRGLSITAPYKDVFLKQVSIVDPIAKALGVINCIRKTADGFEAINTDKDAILEIIKKYDSEKSLKDILILGDGHMGRLTVSILDSIGLTYRVLSRKINGPLEKIDLTTQVPDSNQSLIINTCSRNFIFNGKLPLQSSFWDLNYSFSEHNHLKELCNYTDGMGMLRIQAQFALKFWGIPF